MNILEVHVGDLVKHRDGEGGTHEVQHVDRVTIRIQLGKGGPLVDPAPYVHVRKGDWHE